MAGDLPRGLDQLLFPTAHRDVVATCRRDRRAVDAFDQGGSAVHSHGAGRKHPSAAGRLFAPEVPARSPARHADRADLVVLSEVRVELHFEIVVRGAVIQKAGARVLTANDIHSHNSFDNPRALEPRDAVVRLQGRTAVFRFPPASVTRLQMTLG